MAGTEWAMLIFAALGAASGWVFARDQDGPRDRMGFHGRPAAALAFPALVGVIGASLFGGEAMGLAEFLTWVCLLTGAHTLGFLAAIGTARAVDQLR